MKSPHSTPTIRIRGLTQHNLRDLDLDIPLGRIIAVAGPSGAGKSSLAFDTLYAEAQRRYIETFSPYARQFLERLPRPPARLIDNVPAAIAIGQTNPVKNARSTVGTLADITYPARLLFFRKADLLCPGCGRIVRDEGPADVLSALQAVRREGMEGMALITASIPPESVGAWVRQGYSRALVGQEVREIPSPDRTWKESATIEVVVDRLRISRFKDERVTDSAEQALIVGDGKLTLHLPDGTIRTFSRGRHCARCNQGFPAPNPGLFSFNTSTGACPTCQGFGRIMSVDWNLVVPDPRKSIAEGAIRPLESWPLEKEELMTWCRSNGIDPHTPWRELPDEVHESILYGKGSWPGIKAYFDYLEGKRYKPHVRMLLARYRAYLTCPDCQGTRFRAEARWYRLAGLTLPDVYALSLEQALRWMRTLTQELQEDPAASLLVGDLETRIATLCQAGLGYLTLDRQSRTLSGGEVARVALARAIGTELSETLYVLDEPTVGLHPMDSARILDLLEGLKSRLNTVLIVEHDPKLILAADHVVELGPGAGSEGGRITYQGPPGGWVSEHAESFERRGMRPRAVRSREWRRGDPALVIRGASANNLHDLTVSLPLGCLTCLTGISGSGKSTLMEIVLYRGLLREKGRPTEPPGAYRKMTGQEAIREVHFVDQTPIGRTPKACPASYLKVLDELRKLLAATPAARDLGLAPGAFSFNTPQGRCEACEGRGSEVIEMQFLPDITLPCPVCRGRRFGPKVLSVRYGGKNIYDMLQMTLDEAACFLEDHSRKSAQLASARALGLGHLQLGQPINTLSGGEAQRLKLARHLLDQEENNHLLLLDEPTAGLHPREVARLMAALKTLTARDNTVVVVEHDLDIIREADWVIDLGPGGGDMGGRVIFAGPPERLARFPDSATGRAMREAEASRKLVRRLDKGRPAKGETARTSLSLAPSPSPSIRIQGARHHNLKDLDLDLPKGQFVVVTGISGSGKSSLAFDIVFAEGQRRYVEGLAFYLRQFIRLYERPEVDRVQGLTPSVAIEQRTSQAGPKATVATLTEVAHHLRLLYARVGVAHCPSCGRRLEARERAAILSDLKYRMAGQSIILLAPRVRRRKGWHQPILQAAVRAGLSQVRIDGALYKVPPVPRLSRYGEHTIEWAFGPVAVEPAQEEELIEILHTALASGNGEVTALTHEGTEIHYSERYTCPECGLALPDPDPLLFSFHTRAGACPVCRGMGRIGEDGARCSACGGSRLAQEARAWKVGEPGLHELLAKDVDQALEGLRHWLFEPPWPERLSPVARPLVEATAERLGFLQDMGLGYLPLDRAGDTLSGGEAQRIRLAAQVGAGLTGLTIVLDEPTIGLHARDNARLLKALRRLQKGGNTVIVVEHDEATLRAADWIIDLGPGGGRLGGRIVTQGPPEAIHAHPTSATGRALRNPERRKLASYFRGASATNWLELREIRRRNLTGVDVRIPLGCLVCCTGVSGSGKSTLVTEVLGPSVTARLADPAAPLPHCQDIKGTKALRRVAVVDHSPIGRTPRSCPATYVGFMGELRRLLAQLPLARSRGYGPARFSFNVAGGRCEACAGQGSQRVSLGFLPDVYVRCEDCQGNRYHASTMEVLWRGKNISEILAMTIEEARDLFKAIPSLARPLTVLSELGLGYLTLGQPSPTLSGGEAQRIKLARELARPGHGPTLYLLDEPTTGLHMADCARLVDHLQRLVGRGDTVIVIEHNMDVIRAADWIVDLGPEGGRHGGRVLFSDGPDALIRMADPTPTAEALRAHLALVRQERA